MLCDHCQINEAQDPHPCPYRVEIDEDEESLCNCCKECREKCADNI